MNVNLRRALTAVLLLLAAWDASGEDGSLPLAVKQGDLGVAEALLEKGVDVNARLADGTSALHWAVLDGRGELVALLLRAGADADVTDRYGTAPLSLAALNGDTQTASALLAAGADPNALDSAAETVLMTASRSGNEQLVDLLLEHGAFVGYAEPEFGQTALMLAALENHPRIVALLARYGAQTNVHTRIGPTPPFMMPCKGGCGSEGLGINRGGVPDRGERETINGGMTGLLYAARDGHTDVAKELLAAGAHIEQAEANGITPLLMALINGQMATAHLLLDEGAQVNVTDFYGRSPLYSAVYYRNLDLNNEISANPIHNGVDREAALVMIKRLLMLGADVDARTREYAPQRKWLYAFNDVSWVDFTGETPFVRAALSGDVTTMRLLLKNGADPLITTFAGTSALMAAAGVNWTVTQTYTESATSLHEAVSLCIELGLDVNAANSMGVTALIGAVNRGSDDIIELLVGHGAQIDVQDVEGRTPLVWAEGVFLGVVSAERKPHTIALLKELGARHEE